MTAAKDKSKKRPKYYKASSSVTKLYHIVVRKKNKLKKKMFLVPSVLLFPFCSTSSFSLFCCSFVARCAIRISYDKIKKIFLPTIFFFDFLTSENKTKKKERKIYAVIYIEIKSTKPNYLQPQV